MSTYLSQFATSSGSDGLDGNSDWAEYTLGEAYSFASGLSKGREDFGFGYPFVSFKDVFANYFLPRKLGGLANTTDRERAACSVRRGDVFLTRTSETQDELGLSSVALIDYPEATFNGFTKRLRPRGTVEILPEYAGFYFRSPRFRASVTSMSSITTRASLNNDMLSVLRIAVPPPTEQKAIASVLTGLNEKIYLLHRQNQTLEAMSETLFRHWFGDDASADWSEVGIVEDLFVLQRGYDLPKQDRVDGPFPIITSSGFSGGHAEYKVKAPGVTTGRSGLLGEVYLVHEDFWPLNTSLYVKEFKRGTPIFSYLFLKAMDLSAFNAGSAVPTLNRNHVHAHKVPLPPRDLIERFELLVEPLFRKVHQNGVQSVGLQKLRDSLLPKLMSGEVRVAC